MELCRIILVDDHSLFRSGMRGLLDRYDGIRVVGEASTGEEFLAMLRKARKDGYALDDQAFNAGLRCVAAPIYLGGNKLLFAMSISAPAARMDEAAYENARKLVLKYADLISQEIQSIEFRF